MFWFAVKLFQREPKQLLNIEVVVWFLKKLAEAFIQPQRTE